MQDTMLTYFNGEKNAGLLLAVLGIIALAAAVVFWQARAGPDGLRSFSLTLGLFALIEIGIGVGLYLRTDPQVSALLTQLGSDSAQFFTAEGARMSRVQRNFVVVQYVEVGVIAIAAITALALKHRIAVSGIAMGLLVSAAVLLAFDIIAERRGATYLAALQGVGVSSRAPPR